MSAMVIICMMYSLNQLHIQYQRHLFSTLQYHGEGRKVLSLYKLHQYQQDINHNAAVLPDMIRHFAPNTGKQQWSLSMAKAMKRAQLEDTEEEQEPHDHNKKDGKAKMLDEIDGYNYFVDTQDDKEHEKDKNQHAVQKTFYDHTIEMMNSYDLPESNNSNNFKNDQVGIGNRVRSHSLFEKGDIHGTGMIENLSKQPRVIGKGMPEHKLQGRNETRVIGKDMPEHKLQGRNETRVKGKGMPEHKHQGRNEPRVIGKDMPEHKHQGRNETRVIGKDMPEHKLQGRNETRVIGTGMPEHKLQGWNETRVIGTGMPEHKHQGRNETRVIGTGMPEHKHETRVIGKGMPEHMHETRVIGKGMTEHHFLRSALKPMEHEIHNNSVKNTRNNDTRHWPQVHSLVTSSTYANVINKQSDKQTMLMMPLVVNETSPQNLTSTSNLESKLHQSVDRMNMVQSYIKREHQSVDRMNMIQFHTKRGHQSIDKMNMVQSHIKRGHQSVDRMNMVQSHIKRGHPNINRINIDKTNDTVGSETVQSHIKRGHPNINRMNIDKTNNIEVADMFWSHIKRRHQHVDMDIDKPYDTVQSHHIKRIESDILQGGPHHQYKMYIEMRGRLGNNMFQFASLYSIARALNRTPVISDSYELFDAFNRNLRRVVLVDQPESHVKIVSETFGGMYSTSLYNLPNMDLQLCCYLQSWKYFVEYAHEIHSFFQFKDWIQIRAKSILSSASNLYRIKNRLDSSSHITYVGVHVRRTDVRTPIHLDRGYKAASLSYIYKSMDYFRRKHANVYFIVCSDNMQWCERYLSKPDVYFVEDQDSIVDMAVLTKCNHTIMTVGTFSWWAAWLTGGDVTYYSNWPRPHTEISDTYNHDDYFMPHWKPIGD